MAEQAVVRVTLDTSAAKSQLQELYAMGARGVRMPVGPGGGGGIPGIPGGGGGGVIPGALGAIGGMGLPGLLAALVGASVVGPTARGFGKGVTSVLGDAGSWLAGATGASQFAGELSGIEKLKGQMQDRFGLARGLGLMSGGDVKSIFDAMEPMAVAEGRGREQVGADLSLKRTEHVLERLSGVLERLEGAISGGGGRR